MIRSLKLFTLFIFCLKLIAFQASSTDSISSPFVISESDSILLDSLNDLSYDLTFYDLDSALIIIEQYISISKKNNNYKIADGIASKGYIYVELGDYKTALSCFFNVLKMAEEKADSMLISQSFNDIAMVYMYSEDYDKSIDYYENSIQISKSMNDEKNTSFYLNNYGLVLLLSEDYDKALEVFKDALDIKQKFKEIENDDEELYYLDIDIAMLESNIGLIHKNNKEYDKALEVFQDAKTIFKKINNANYLSLTYTNLADIYFLKNELKLAENYAKLSLKAIEETDFINHKSNSYQILFEVYEKLNFNSQALFYYENFILLQDSILREDNQQAFAEAEIKYEYDKKIVKDSLVNLQKQRVFDASLAVKNAELKSQNRITNGVVFILFLIVVFSILIWIRYQKNQQEKEVIQDQKKVMDDAYEELESNKKQIEQKNKEIIDSIYYARYIQRALYPDEDLIKDYFKDYVIFNFPKDIVGGDFHWFKSFGDKAVAIAADCTGHGVPGGFITVLGNLFIESSTGDKPLSPNQILSDINNELVTVLKQDEKDAIQDGMDLAICLIDKKERKLVFSGSRNGIYIINNKGELKEIKGDYTPVGGFYSKKEKFKRRDYELHEIKLKKDEWVFMYSDGYYDQFGGPKNKSMGSTRFKEMLSNAVKENKLKTSHFKEGFFNWMGDNEQIDDVLVMGFNL